MTTPEYNELTDFGGATFASEVKGWAERVEAKHGITLSFAAGSKFVKVITGNSAYCFLNRAGEVLKAATWKAPAKHARGYINKEGLEGVDKYGAHYLI